VDTVICEWKGGKVLLGLSLAEGMADFQEVSYLPASAGTTALSLADRAAGQGYIWC
jgi:fibrillarin-like rRNA methylase